MACYRDFAYKMGCGRYLQGHGVLESTAEEILRAGAHRALVIGGVRALAVALPRLAAHLEQSGIPYEVCEHRGHCCVSYMEAYAARAKSGGAEIILGVGGGKIMDLAKGVAAVAALPCVNIPTSAATCAAYTPLSVVYTEDGKTVPPSIKHKKEVNAVIADLDLLLTEPPRLLIAGAYDALAKKIELDHRIKGKRPEEMVLGLEYAAHLSELTYRKLCALLPEALEALKTGVCNRAFEEVVYINLAVTGVISGISKGSGQTALAHEFYELARTLYTEPAADFIHGELVGMGLAVQLDYNGEGERIESITSLLREYGLPVYLSDIGVAESEENLRALADEMNASGSMEDTGDEEKARVYRAVRRLIRA